jgi:hypothetical protein
MIKIDDDSNIIHHIDKPRNTDMTQMWGIACWERTFTDKLSFYVQQAAVVNKEVILGDIIDIMVREKFICKGFPIREGKYYDIGTYDDFKKAITEIP